MKFSTLVVVTMILTISAGPVYAIPMTSVGEHSKAAPAQVTDPAEQAYQEGLKFLVAGKLDLAQQAFQKSLRQSPSLSKSILGLAEVAFKQNNLKESKRWINLATEKAPDDPHVQVSLARLLYLQADYDGAKTAFLKTLKLDPEMNSARIALGDLYLTALKQPEEAIKTYRKALENKPDHAGARYALGMALLANNDIEMAQTELLKASKNAPENPLPYFSLGNIAAKQQQLNKALEYYDKVLAIDPANIKTLLSRGAILQNMNKDDKAIRDYEAALVVNSKLFVAQMKLGKLYQKHNQNEKAKVAYKKAIELNPEAVHAYNNLAWMAAESGTDLDQAVVWGKKATELAPKSASVFDTLGWVYRARKEYPLAISTLQKAAKLNPKQASVFYHLGLTYMEQGNNKQAVDALNNVVSIDNKSQLAVRALELLAQINSGG